MFARLLKNVVISFNHSTGSSSSGKKNVGLAFSYVAGDEGKLADASKVLKNTSPRHEKSTKAADGDERGNKDNIDYVESAYLKEKDSNVATPGGTLEFL